MKKFFSDFKKFISRGNVLDLAVAVIIGAAFGKIVSSLVADIIMPLITLCFGDISVADLKWKTVMYGSFIQSIIDFLIIAFCIFLVVRLVMGAQRKIEEIKKKNEQAPAPAPAEPAKPTQEQLLTEIRDLLKAQSGADQQDK